MEYDKYLLHKFSSLANNKYIELLISHYGDDFLIQFETVFIDSYSEGELWKENKIRYLDLFKNSKSAELDDIRNNVSLNGLDFSECVFLEYLRKNKEDRFIFFREIILCGLQGIFPDLYLVAPVLLKIIEESEKHKESNKKDLKKMVLFKLVVAQFFKLNALSFFQNQKLNRYLLETHFYPFLFKVLGLELDLSVGHPLQDLVQYAKVLNPNISQNKLAKIFGVERKTIREATLLEPLNTNGLNRTYLIDLMDIAYEELQKAQGKIPKDFLGIAEFRPSKEIEEIIKKIEES